LQLLNVFYISVSHSDVIYFLIGQNVSTTLSVQSSSSTRSSSVVIMSRSRPPPCHFVKLFPVFGTNFSTPFISLIFLISHPHFHLVARYHFIFFRRHLFYYPLYFFTLLCKVQNSFQPDYLYPSVTRLTSQARGLLIGCFYFVVNSLFRPPTVD